jgi:hypothetical protein
LKDLNSFELKNRKNKNDSDSQKMIRKKSLNTLSKNKSQDNLREVLKSGDNKLRNFLKDENVAIVKTKIEYDYSAIF